MCLKCILFGEVYFSKVFLVIAKDEYLSKGTLCCMESVNELSEKLSNCTA